MRARRPASFEAPAGDAPRRAGGPMPLAFPARMLLCVARLALPQACALCGALCGNMSQWALCRGCDAAYWNEPRQRCRVCALPLAAAHAGGRAGIRGRPHYVCVRCERLPPPFDATLALADYRPPLDRLALALKFRRRLFVARELAARLAQRAQDEFDREPNPEVVAPVPLAHERLVERGYNQAWEIAKPLARLLGVRADATLLRRVAHTAPQSKLDLDARRRNVGDAFAVTRPVAGAHVALVDDVMTSGSTLEAAARALKAAGAQRVTNFVALRTPRD